jgi:crotonobetainyl-CoA:carnitine CoA-transferase CaiB-like acyl-CoA transferase
VIVAVGNDAQYARFCAILDLPHLATDPAYATNPARLENREVLIDLLEPVLRQQGQATLLAAMEAKGVPGGPINQLDQVFDSDQVRAREMKVAVPHPHSATGTVDLIGNPVKFSQTPVTYRRSPPVCGADSAEILDELAQLKSARQRT